MKRNMHVALGVLTAATIFAGCGSGGATIGGNSNPNPISTATLAPGVTPSPTPLFSLAPGASPTPSPTLPAGVSPTPSASANVGANGAIYHPANNGDQFTMAGTLLVTYDRSNQYPTPEPTSTTLDSVTQTISVVNPATFNGVSNAAEFVISETDNQSQPATQSFSDTMDQYVAFPQSMTAGSFLNLGFTEVDDNGYQSGVTTGANDQLADMLPEAQGQTWANTAARTVTTNDGNGTTSSTTYADNGSYTGTITYQNYMPSPNPTGSQLTNQANLTANVDGSANYTTPRLGTAVQYNYVYAIQAPTASGPTGTITETTTVPPAAGSTATPEAVSTTVPNWLPTSVPGSLASETDVDNGPTALPSSCSVPTNAGTPNSIVQKKTRVDPLNGELETTTTTTYDVANIGPVCVVLHDVQQNYYDYSGQNGTGYFSGVPQQTTTIDETLYLGSETLNSIGRRPKAGLRSSLTSVMGVATAEARVSALRTARRMKALANHKLRGVLQ